MGKLITRLPSIEKEREQKAGERSRGERGGNAMSKWDFHPALNCANKPNNRRAQYKPIAH